MDVHFSFVSSEDFSTGGAGLGISFGMQSKIVLREYKARWRSSSISCSRILCLTSRQLGHRLTPSWTSAPQVAHTAFSSSFSFPLERKRSIESIFGLVLRVRRLEKLPRPPPFEIQACAP